jgi:hypothetical protein
MKLILAQIIPNFLLALHGFDMNISMLHLKCSGQFPFGKAYQDTESHEAGMDHSRILLCGPSESMPVTYKLIIPDGFSIQFHK